MSFSELSPAHSSHHHHHHHNILDIIFSVIHISLPHWHYFQCTFVDSTQMFESMRNVMNTSRWCSVRWWGYTYFKLHRDTIKAFCGHTLDMYELFSECSPRSSIITNITRLSYTEHTLGTQMHESPFYKGHKSIRHPY